MIWLRSWPRDVPPGRHYIQDSLPRLVMEGYDYTPLAGIADDVCLLEWDVALDAVERERFAAHALARPERVLVAPYRLYGIESEPVWCHRRLLEDVDGWAPKHTRWVADGERMCDYFSFGCIYLPHALVMAFLAAEAPARGRSPLLPPEAPYTDTRFHDQTFSVWHRHHGPEVRVPIAWEVHPQHVHC